MATSTVISKFPNNGICRLCMGEKSDLKSVFDKNLPMKVMRLADVRIAEDDGLPTTVCMDCESDVGRCFIFIDQIKWSDTKLREGLQMQAPKMMFEECNIKQEQMYPEFGDESADCHEQEPSNQYNAFEDVPDYSDEKKENSENEVIDPKIYMKEEAMIVDVNLPAPSSSSVKRTDLYERIRSKKEDQASCTVNLLPEKSKRIYEERYTKYEQWCKSKGVEDITDRKKHISSPLSSSEDELSDIVVPEIVLEIEQKPKRPARMAMIDLLPEKSKQTYDHAYANFMQWRKTKKVNTFSEDAFLIYFEELSTKWKPSTLWSHYSMVKSTIFVKHKIDISNYTKLISLLRRKSDGYTGKKTKVFTCKEIKSFLDKAPDEKHLLTKVSLIFGVMGACRRHELHQLKWTDVHDVGSHIIVTLPTERCKKKTRTFTITGKYYNLCKKYIDLRPNNCPNEYFFLNYQKQKCTVQNVGINKIGSMGKVIAAYLNLPNPELYTGHCFRRSSKTLLVDETGDILEDEFRRCAYDTT